MQERLPNKIRPRANEVVVTADRDAVVSTNKVLTNDEQQQRYSLYQTVLSTGPVVRDLVPGDVVCIKYNNYAKYQEQKSRIKAAVDGYEKVLIGYELPIIETAFGDVFLIKDSDIGFVVEDGFTELPDEDTVVN
jgi:hypothetical protein